MKDLAKGYWARVVMGPNVGDCWEWSGAHVNGRAYLSDTGPKRLIRVTRWLWERMQGPIPPGHIIRHTCDNPGCVNLLHLQVGTQADNMRDMVERGRSLTADRNPMRLHPEARLRGDRWAATHMDRRPTGSRHGMARLTEQDVLAIRSDVRPARFAAAEFGVSIDTIREIRRRETWRHI